MYFQEPDAQMASVTSQYGEKKWHTGGRTEINHALLVDRPVAKGSLAAAAPPIDATRMPNNAAPFPSRRDGVGAGIYSKGCGRRAESIQLLSLFTKPVIERGPFSESTEFTDRPQHREMRGG